MPAPGPSAPDPSALGPSALGPSAPGPGALGRSSRPRALLLGGTGSLWQTASHLARAGWAVTVTGRDADRLPPTADELGVRFVALDRADVHGHDRLLGEGADLLVDGQGYTPQQAEDLARWSRRCGSTAYLSAKAVYVDPSGHHLNSPEGVRFPGPVDEATPTLPWHGEPWDTAEGYGPNKAEAERRLLDRGERVSVLRPSKIHGPWVRQARTAAVLALAGPARPGTRSEGGNGSMPRRGSMPNRGPVRVRGAGVVESTTSAEVLARAVLAVARTPGQRVLNVADADPRPAGELARAVWRAAGCDPVPIVVEADAGHDASLDAADHAGAEPAVLPWRVPMVLDTSALSGLGVALPTFAETVWMEVEWLSRTGVGP